MKALEKALSTINSMTGSRQLSAIDPRIRLGVTLLYIAMVLSVPMLDPALLIWMFLFPIVCSEATGIGYGRVLLKSLWVLPLIILIGIFNPILDQEPLWRIGGITISRGWVMFISVMLRGLLSFQVLLILTMSMGFQEICHALRGLGCPAVLTTQLAMLWRYLGVLMQEAITMQRAREARGFGRKSYPLKMWGIFVGQLLVRSLHRSRRVDDAMTARCFGGEIRFGNASGIPSSRSWVWMLAWIAIFAALRFIDFTTLLNTLVMNHL